MSVSRLKIPGVDIRPAGNDDGVAPPNHDDPPAPPGDHDAPPEDGAELLDDAQETGGNGQDQDGELDDGKQQSGDPDLDDFLDEPDVEHDWLIPDVLERGERWILTGAEGIGKSELCRGVAIQTGAGIHPFTLEPMDPLRVLLVDCENGRRHVRRKLRTLRNVAGDRLNRGQVIPIIEPSGVDLLEGDAVRWLTERIECNRPDLVIIGPLYKLAGGDPTSEEVARRVSGVFDQLRGTFAIALLIEAHSPYASAGKRPERPYGASLWSRWPEFGLHLSAQGQLHHWRGDRDEREWPTGLTRGGAWPWTVATDQRTTTFARILDELRDHGSQPSIRHLAEKLEVDKGQIERAIKANRAQWDQLIEDLDQ
ncbi:MAG: AAA family ATPase [Acidimicrobiia bacterium]